MCLRPDGFEAMNSGRTVMARLGDSELQGGADGTTKETNTHVEPPQVELTIDPMRVRRILLISIGLLVTASTALQAAVYFLPDFPLRDAIARLFYVDFERSIPTLYSTVMLLTSAVLFGSIAHAHHRGGRRYVRHWGALSLAFLLLGLDEFAAVHEQTIRSVLSILEPEGGGAHRLVWVVPVVLAVAAFGIAFARFLGHLPRTTRRRLWVAGILLVGGAIGVDLVGSGYSAVHGAANFNYVLIATVEECLEMLGSAVLVYALLAYVPVGLPEVGWRLRIAASD